ncbi:hypothetical protein LCGC14_2435970 [marine sediment metagenome]|uniref:Uncharacterized protein n=1 Tax=marine sediment metagenome TaxID=412755 RepID=A0A0F9DXI0_9ZZZZ
MNKLFGENEEKAFEPYKTVECPQCRFRWPIPTSLIDYGRLYRQEKEYRRKMGESFAEWLLELRAKVPEVETYYKAKAFEIQQLFNLSLVILGADGHNEK